MYWFGVVGANGGFGRGQTAAISCNSTLSGTPRRVATQLWPSKTDPRGSMGTSGPGRRGMKLLDASER